MSEPAKLVSARAHLARAETDYRSRDGLFRLREGLALLEEVAVDGAARDRTIVANLVARYAARVCEAIERTVETEPALAEPELEHLFQVLLAFDAVDLRLPDYVRPLKIDIVRRLVELYYEGHTQEAKRRALEELAGIAAGPR